MKHSRYLKLTTYHSSVQTMVKLSKIKSQLSLLRKTIRKEDKLPLASPKAEMDSTHKSTVTEVSTAPAKEGHTFKMLVADVEEAVRIRISDEAAFAVVR